MNCRLLKTKRFRRAVHCCGFLCAAISSHSYCSPPGAASAVCIGSPIPLPIEVMGEDGTEVCIEMDVPAGVARRVSSLWLQVHGLEYADMASIQINQGQWVRLNNRTATVAEPGKSYGGIGGGFATLVLTLPVTSGDNLDVNNQLRFRFNHSNGIASGFRVLALNLLAPGGERLLPPSDFVLNDPSRWLVPLPESADILAGERAWAGAVLRSSDLGDAQPIRAHCADCHARDGRDLKYFNYSSHSIVVRSRFHGLSTLQGYQIASYIRTLPYAAPGRPWNPPYQPGPSLRNTPVTVWAAGAGLSSVLDDDADTLDYLFKPAAEGAKPGNAAVESPQSAMVILPASFAPDGDLDTSLIPIALQLPDWNHWLPQVHPVDAWGDAFLKSSFSHNYESAVNLPRTQGASRAFFAQWLQARKSFLHPRMPGAASATAASTRNLYGTLLWQQVKTWEITEAFGLEQNCAPTQTCSSRGWPNYMAAATAPAEAGIPDTVNGMNGSALTNEYFNNCWYQLQIQLNSGNHAHSGRAPIDWVYLAGHEQSLEHLSGRPEPGRLLAMAIRANQSTDIASGPQDNARGWRPEQNIDPRMLVADHWQATFSGLPASERQSMTQAWLEAWLDKSTRYPVADYFYRAQLPAHYILSPELHEISGGAVWTAAASFRAAGVDASIVNRLQAWGDEYMRAAELFHY